MSTIGERIYDLRNRRGLTQAELGEIIGESKQTIYKYERGIISNIPLSKVEAIAKALHCPPVALTGWESKGSNQDPVPIDEDQVMLTQLFAQLPPDGRKLIIAQLRAAVQAYKDPDDR